MKLEIDEEMTMTTLETAQLRERVLTLLLIERNQINERLVELGLKEIKSPAVKRGARACPSGRR